MHFEGEFRVPGTPDEVIRRFADVPRMTRCMPGAVLEPQAEDGSWPGAMVVSFGPKKINFKGRVTCSFDNAAHTGELQGRGTADMRAARIGVKVAFALRADPAVAEATTIVKVVSDAELGGVLADFARTGGVAVANVIMADFARRASEEFARDAPPPAEAVASDAPPPVAAGELAQPTATAHAAAPRRPLPRPLPPPQPAVPLAAHSLLWAVVKAQFARLATWLGLRKGG